MRANRSTSGSMREAAPLALGALGVACFSMTFPATTAAETSFSPLTVGVGRSVIAAAIALVLLAVRRQPLLPPRAALPRMLVVAATVGVGFGLLSALALHQVSSVHGAVLTGLIPAATAGMAVLRAGERPRPAYWAALGLGLAVVIGFALIQGGGSLHQADLLLIVAIVIGGLGYAEGGALAREYGGWRVICWAVILALPVTVPVTAVALAVSPPRHLTGGAVLGPRLRRCRLDVPGLLRLVPRHGCRRRGADRADPAGPARADSAVVGAAARRTRQLAERRRGRRGHRR